MGLDSGSYLRRSSRDFDCGDATSIRMRKKRTLLDDLLRDASSPFWTHPMEHMNPTRRTLFQLLGIGAAATSVAVASVQRDKGGDLTTDALPAVQGTLEVITISGVTWFEAKVQTIDTTQLGDEVRRFRAGAITREVICSGYDGPEPAPGIEYEVRIAASPGTCEALVTPPGEKGHRSVVVSRNDLGLGRQYIEFRQDQ